MPTWRLMAQGTAEPVMVCTDPDQPGHVQQRIEAHGGHVCDFEASTLEAAMMKARDLAQDGVWVWEHGRTPEKMTCSFLPAHAITSLRLLARGDQSPTVWHKLGTGDAVEATPLEAVFARLGGRIVQLEQHINRLEGRTHAMKPPWEPAWELSKGIA